jgi:hypothetical protein
MFFVKGGKLKFTSKEIELLFKRYNRFGKAGGIGFTEFME